MSLRVGFMLLVDDQGRYKTRYIGDISKIKAVKHPTLTTVGLLTEDIDKAHRFKTVQFLQDEVCELKRIDQGRYTILDIIDVMAPTSTNKKILADRKEKCRDALKSVNDLINRAKLKYKNLGLMSKVNYDIVYSDRYKEPILEVVVLFYGPLMRNVFRLDIIPYSTPSCPNSYVIIDSRTGDPIYNIDNLGL